MERNEISSLLEQLYRHRESCEMIWLKTDEVDSPESELAREHLNGVEECVQIVRAWADDAWQTHKRLDIMHDAVWAGVLMIAMIFGIFFLGR